MLCIGDSGKKMKKIILFIFAFSATVSLYAEGGTTVGNTTSFKGRASVEPNRRVICKGKKGLCLTVTTKIDDGQRIGKLQGGVTAIVDPLGAAVVIKADAYTVTEIPEGSVVTLTKK